MNIAIKRAMAGGLLAMAATAVAVPAEASAARSYYGAISYSNSTGRWGTANNFDSASDARFVARQQCGVADCQVMPLKDNCGALVRNKTTRSWWWAYAPTRNAAKSKAFEFAGWQNVELLTSICVG